MTLRWDRHFLQLALDHARMSKDPSTRVGAIIVGPDREIRSVGFNGFPRGIGDSPARLGDRAMKNKLMVHAEVNAIAAAARVGIPIKDCTLYVAPINAVNNHLWGGPPCVRCIVEIIQSGIVEVVSYTKAYVVPRWDEDVSFADLTNTLMSEALITYREVTKE